jgi:hypothetical protein
VLGGEGRDGGVDELFAIVARVGEDGFVLDDIEIIDAQPVAIANQLDGLEGAVADVDAPCETVVGHGEISSRSRDARRLRRIADRELNGRFFLLSSLQRVP